MHQNVLWTSNVKFLSAALR